MIKGIRVGDQAGVCRGCGEGIYPREDSQPENPLESFANIFLFEQAIREVPSNPFCSPSAWASHLNFIALDEGAGEGNWFLMLTRALCSSIPELAGEHLRYSSESKRIKIQFYSKCLLISLLRMCAACHIRGNTQIFCSVRFCQSKADVFAINGVRRRAERGKSKNNIRNNSNLGSSKSLS